MQILLVEDNADDALLLHELLESVWPGKGTVTHTRQCGDAIRFLATVSFDLVLLDLSLPDSVGVDTFRKVFAQSPHTPIIVLTYSDDDNLAIETVQSGAQDYLVKSELTANLLARTIRYAIERNTLKAALAREADLAIQRETNLHNIIADSLDGVVVLDNAGCIRFGNRAAEHLLGFDMGSARGLPVGEVFLTPQSGEGVVLVKTGETVPAEIRINETEWEGEPATLVLLRDMSRQRRIETQLRFQSQLLDSVRESIVACDLDGIVRYWGRGAERLFGYSLVEVLARPLAEVVDVGGESDWRIRLLHILQHGVWRGERIQQRKSGEKFSAQSTSSLIRDEAGEPLGIVTIDRDISDKRVAEDAFKDLLAQQSAILNALPFAIVLIDAEGIVLAVNDGWLMFQGHEHPSSGRCRVGDNYFEALKRIGAEGAAFAFDLAQLLQQILQGTKEVANLDFTTETTAGSQWYRAIASPLGNEHAKNVVIAFAEITETRLTQEALRQQTEMLHAVLENIPVMLDIVGPDGEIRYLNREQERVLGWSLEEAKARDVMRDYYPDPVYHDEVIKHIRELDTGWYDCLTTTKDGKKVVTSWANIRLSDDSRVGIGIDLTERKKLEEQFLQSQKMESIGRLAGGIAHDFNNLLSAILGYAEFAASALPEGDPVRADIEQIDAAGRRAADLTRRLLTFARKQVFQPRVVDINELVLRTHKMLRRLIGEDIELVTLPHAVASRVMLDPGQFEQVLVNLAVNSRDAMPQGGKLTIETNDTHLDATKARMHGVELPGKYIEIDVTDTGVGIPPEVRARIFEPFFTTKEQGKGTGLGLATSYGIVRQSGGYIWVYSEVGKGTAFKILLPGVDSGISVDFEAEAAAPAHGGSETILVVEDESMVRNMAVRALKQAGYQVIQADSGNSALDVLRNHKDELHLLLTDVVMPLMGGRELAQNLLRDRPNTKVLFMSGYTEDAIIHHDHLVEGTAFIAKPWTPHELIRAVRQLLDEV